MNIESFAVETEELPIKIIVYVIGRYTFGWSLISCHKIDFEI